MNEYSKIKSVLDRIENDSVMEREEALHILAACDPPMQLLDEVADIIIELSNQGEEAFVIRIKIYGRLAAKATGEFLLRNP